MIADVKLQISKAELSEEAQQLDERRRARETRRLEREHNRKLREKHGSDWRAYKQLENFRVGSGTSITSLLPDSFKQLVQEKYASFEKSTNRMGPSMVFLLQIFTKTLAPRPTCCR